jgi:hypothetical protein
LQENATESWEWLKVREWLPGVVQFLLFQVAEIAASLPVFVFHLTLKSG